MHPLLTFLTLAILPATALALDLEALKASVNADMQGKIGPTLIAAIVAQNAAHARLTNADILKFDSQWKAEVTAEQKPLITSVLNNPASAELKKIAADSNGRYREIFITDNRGLNVAATAATSDYWQGDEAKFQQTFLHGPNTVYAEEPRFDESAQAFVNEIDGTISNGGQAIGTYTVKVTAEQAAR
jgi:hypothetical protein